MKRSHALLILILSLGLLLIGSSLAALAAGETKQVGLVIAFPDGSRHAEVVTVPVTATTMDVLHAAKVEIVDATGQFGPTVCSINKTGCAASNCFCDPKHFWAFYELDKATNKWVASQQGVGAAVPANGAVEGFAWSEMDANYNPLTQPPVMTFAEIQAASGQPAASQAAATQPAATQPAATTAPAAQPTATGAGPAKLPATGGSAGVWLLALAACLLVCGLWLTWATHLQRGKG